MNTIKEQWDSFRMLVVPADASEVQLQETRRAFYAGAEAMMRIQFNIGDKDVSEDEGVAILSACHDEAEEVAQKVRKQVPGY